ncbi:hypothetical protein RUM43_011138 [Polyplax serrata]|uniref:Uncharacterized protein n=1 Tax=Polyplax serrata TaxID=468196 RepID=A0AAN8PET2_POLSC
MKDKTSSGVQSLNYCRKDSLCKQMRHESGVYGVQQILPTTTTTLSVVHPHYPKPLLLKQQFRSTCSSLYN